MAKKNVSPVRLLDLSWSFSITRTLITAVEIRLFTHVAAGKVTVAQLARASHSSHRGIRMLADALVGLGLLRRRGRAYRLTTESAAFLVQGKPTYIGDMIQHTGALWSTWEHLTEAVRHGAPVRRGEAGEGDQAGFFAELVRALFNSSYLKGQMAAKTLRGRGYTHQRILDVAAGSAGWSIPFAELNHRTRVSALDFPTVLDVTREFVANHELTSQFEYLPGNLRSVPFGESRYDLIILGNICHSEGQAGTKRLFRKSFRALQPGGQVLIAETLPDDGRRNRLYPLLFALNMLVHTPRGDVFTLREYRGWLKEVGFGKIFTVDVNSRSPLIVAVKPRR